MILLFKAGGTYPVTDALTVRGADVVIGRYGVGDRPVLMLLRGAVDEHGRGPRGGIAVDGKCDGVMIEHLTFASPYHPGPDGAAPKVGLQAIVARGRNVAVRGCAFRDVDDAVNANGGPTGLLVQDCEALGLTDLRGYLIWGEGSDQAYIGNRAANSTREHIVRMTGMRRVLIFGNDFANPDRSKVDPGDGTKGCIEAHLGSWEYIAGNRVAWGPIRTGPRGGREAKTTATEWVVVDGNDLTNAQVRLDVGSHHVMVRNNVQRNDGGTFVEVDRPDADGRVSADLTVAHNTGIDAGPSGIYLKVWGRVDGLAVADNLFVAPQLHAGTVNAAVNVQAGGLSWFTAMSHDLWPTPATYEHGSDGGVCVLGDAGFDRRRGYLTAAEWAGTRPVDGDRFVAAGPTTVVDDHGIPLAGGPADGTAVPFPGTAFDHDGRPRSPGKQAAGAFEQTVADRGSMTGR